MQSHPSLDSFPEDNRGPKNIYAATTSFSEHDHDANNSDQFEVPSPSPQSFEVKPNLRIIASGQNKQVHYHSISRKDCAYSKNT